MMSLGLLSLVHIAGKIILQEIWARKIFWDEEVPADVLSSWQQWTSELTLDQNHPVETHWQQHLSKNINPGKNINPTWLFRCK